VAEVVNIDPVKIVVDVPEREVHYLAVGDEATVVARLPETRVFVGRITYISELADELTRTSRLEILIDNPEYLLRSGQIVRARLTRRLLEDVIMIPLSAVIPLEHGRVVYVVNDDDQAERREVELGFITGRDVRVLGGLEPGARLIVVGHRYVGPGQPVVITEDLTPDATADAAQP
jgi:membrane fusion protein (multidrug efflux system)